jgi:hypothetical protein
MNPRIIKVETLQDYKLLLEFANGESKIFDMNKYLDFGVFKELKDVNYFNRVKVGNGSIFWSHEQDLCPDTLYLDSVKIT